MKLRSNPLTSVVLVTLAAISTAHSANFYWDGTTVVVDGTSAGGSAIWAASTAGWEDGASAQNWADGNLAVFGGTGGTVTVGGAVSVSGVVVGASSTAYSLTASSRQVLSIGSSGIDMSASSLDLPVNNITLAVGGNSQTWNVATGRNLFLSATNALNGQLTGTNAATITVTGGGLIDLLPNATGATGFAGQWLVQGGSTLRTTRSNSAALGTGGVTLNGGTLAIGGVQGSGAQGNWTFNNAITLGTAAANVIDHQNPTGGSQATRWLKLESVLSGSGNITFHNSQFANGVMTSDEFGFILSAANTFSGTVTVDANAYLRIGGSSIGTNDSNAGNNGSIANSSAITNNGVLRLTRNDSWTLANNISGTGAVKIGGTAGTTTSQVATLSGASNYTGATTVINGTLKLSGSLASPVTVNSGSKLTGSGSTTGLLTMTAGSALVLPGDGTTTSVAANGVTFSGATELIFSSPPLAGSVYDVLTYGGGAVTDLGNLTIVHRGTLTDDTVNHKLTFVAGGVGTRTWNAAANDGFWDLGVGANWLEGDQFFFGGDTVIFGDISTNSPITLEGRLVPASVTVNNAVNTYTFTGAAGTHEIAGAGSLTKNNAGTLAIASIQSYTGGTTINGGILDLGGTTAGGAGIIRGTVTVNAGGALRLSIGDATGYNTDATRVSSINLVGGSLNVNTTSNQTLGSAVINMTGGSIIGIPGSNLDLFAGSSAINTFASTTESSITLPTMNLRQDNTTFTVADGAAVRDLVISSNLGNGSGGTHNLIKAGAGNMVLTGSNGYTGATTVSAGTLTVAGTTSATSGVNVNGGGSLLVRTGGSLTTTGSLSTANATGASIVVENGATFTAASGTIAWNPGTFKIEGALNITGALTVSTNATAPFTGAGTITAGSFVTGNAATVVNYSTAAMNISGVVKIGSALAANSNTFNQTAGVITAGGLQLGDGVSTVAQTYTLTGGSLILGSSGITTAGTGARIISLGGATLGAAAPWSSTLAMTLTSTTIGTTFDTTGGNISLGGALAGVGAKLVKSGGGTLILTGANTYTGDTVVNAGSLSVNGTAIANSGKMVINGGKVDVTGTETVNTLFFGGAQQLAGTWGSSLSTATHKNDTYFSGSGVVLVTSGPVGGYSAWAATNAGGGAANGDSDNDGVSNGIEYFLGLAGSLTANAGVVEGKVTWINGGNIASTAYGTEFVVQTSSDLSAWTNVLAGDPNLANTNGSIQYTFPTGAGKVFARLVVTPN